MKKLTYKPFSTAFIAAGLFLFSLSAFAASVSSMVNLGSKQNELGETIDVVDVKCTSASAEPRIIFSREGERQWCSQDVPSVCTRSKLSAAQRVCRAGFANQIEEYKNSQIATTGGAVQPASAPQVQAVPAPVVAAPAASIESQTVASDVELEKQRILIEQQKLEIRKQELELNKRQLELERQATSQ